VSYQYAGKDFKEPTRYVPASEDEARAKFAYFRDAEDKINGGPAPIIYATPKPLKPIRPRLDIPLCGTCSGYARHIRLRQEPCRPCLDARRNYQREYRARKRATGIAGIAPKIIHTGNRIDTARPNKTAPAVRQHCLSGT
jgi:hypothetical protein